MKQEDKILLIKDLCGRLPYEIKGKTTAGEITPLIRRGEADYDIITSIKIIIEKHGWRPYLFPSSSMTEEQLKLFDGVFLPNGHIVASDFGVDYLNSIHVDYRGLISLGLAEDATGKNIY